jgi:6,7-dimethyl-8-ribityllumazine synthase
MTRREFRPREGADGPASESAKTAADNVEADIEAGPGSERESRDHAPGDLNVPHPFELLEGESRATPHGIGIVVSRFNGELTNALLESALNELGRLRIHPDQITIIAVPGAFELPLGALRLAKTNRYACIVVLGCVIRGETSHFEYVAGAAASGAQLAALETGVPIAFGVLTVDTQEQAKARLHNGAGAVQAALEMADLFQLLDADGQK